MLDLDVQPTFFRVTCRKPEKHDKIIQVLARPWLSRRKQRRGRNRARRRRRRRIVAAAGGNAEGGW